MARRCLILCLLVLTLLYTPQLSVLAKPHNDVEMEISITDCEVGSFDEYGEDNDVKIYGSLEIESEEPVNVILTLHLTGIDGTKDRWHFTVVLDDIKGEFEFTFVVYNIKSGWYEAYLEVKHKNIEAQSETIVFDPPGGTPGPLGYEVM